MGIDARLSQRPSRMAFCARLGGAPQDYVGVPAQEILTGICLQ